MYDVIVMGGGPAGATAAALLARTGANVLVVEKERFPRFHIGESLLPCSLSTLRTIGLEVSAPLGTYKGGAEFFDEAEHHYARFPFADALSPENGKDHAYQVERAEFDAALLERARRLGASVQHGERVVTVHVDAESVTVTTDRETRRARFCIDATGQEAFFARRDRTIEKMDGFGRAAVFTHFDCLDRDGEKALGTEGDIKVLMQPGRWTWIIPLSGQRVSIGTVTRDRGVTPALIEETIGESPLVRSIVSGARRRETRIVGNFSFRNTRRSGPRFACVGDAACFLDPVFSSGVALALFGAEATVERLVPALAANVEDDPNLLVPAEERMDHAYRFLSALVHAFYHTNLVKNLFFNPRPDPEMRAGLISMLAGDLWRDDNRFQNRFSASRRRWAPVGPKNA